MVCVAVVPNHGFCHIESDRTAHLCKHRPARLSVTPGSWVSQVNDELHESGAAMQAWCSELSGAHVTLSCAGVHASASGTCAEGAVSGNWAIGATKFEGRGFEITLKLQDKKDHQLSSRTKVGLIGSNGQTWSYDSSGIIASGYSSGYSSGVQTTDAPAYGLGDVITITYRDGDVSFALNGVSQGVRFQNVQLPLRAFADCTCTVAKWSFLDKL